MFEINGSAYPYDAEVYNNTVVTYDCFAFTGANTRYASIHDNVIDHSSSSCMAISYGSFAGVIMVFSCMNNTITPNGGVLITNASVIEFTGAYVAGSTYTFQGNKLSNGVTAEPSVSFLAKTHSAIKRGQDGITYAGIQASPAGAFSFTVDKVPDGFYLVDMHINNGDNNHAMHAVYVVVFNKAGVNTLAGATLASAASCGTLVTAAALSIVGDDLICSGTTALSLTSVYYHIKIVPIAP